MSKIGRMPISIPEGVKVEISSNLVKVIGPQGQLETPVMEGIRVELKDNQLFVSPSNHEKQTKANHGLIRSLLNNNVIGVTKGFKKVLKMVGTGYRVQQKGTGLNLQVGLSHDIEYQAPEGIKLAVEGNDTIIVTGIDKQQVGQVAAVIRSFKKPEPYKGKGIRYEDEEVKRKQGKATVA